MRPAVFLDRDDTLIVNRAQTAHTSHPGDLFDPALVQLTPGAGAACRDLKAAGFALVVVTNQGAVARGECTVAQVEATNSRMREVLLGVSGVDLDGVYYCPYHPGGGIAPWNIEHAWRKPAPGMFLAAAKDLAIDLARSWMIGDAERDIAAAIAAGLPLAHTILLAEPSLVRGGHKAAGMSEAAATILAYAAR